MTVSRRVRPWRPVLLREQPARRARHPCIPSEDPLREERYAGPPTPELSRTSPSTGLFGSSYFGPYASHIGASKAVLVSRIARPSAMTTLSPSSRRMVIDGFSFRLAIAREPVLNQNPSTSHTPHTGRVWGEPSGRVVAIQ